MKEKVGYGLIIFIAFVCGGLTMYYFNYSKLSSVPDVETNADIMVEKSTHNYDNSSVSAASLKEAIDKIYDATVMVNNYKNDKVSNTGSGFIYKVDSLYGYVMTNHHVISDSEKVTLILTDDMEVEATILGSDQYLDLAVLRIDRNDVKTVASIGKDSECSLGDAVFSVGSPLGYEYRGTVTNGIISGLNRLVEVSVNGSGDDWVMEVIQTNTAVNPGNSGGPLVNANGEVVGIISLKLVENSVEGMGFAIPIEYAMSHVDILESGKKIDRPLLGISMLNVSASTTLEKYYDIIVDEKITKGVVVVDISEDSGASRSSLKKGDIITKIGDKNVENVAYLKYLLYKYNVGDTVALTYYRDGSYKTTKIILTKNNE